MAATIHRYVCDCSRGVEVEVWRKASDPPFRCPSCGAFPSQDGATSADSTGIVDDPGVVASDVHEWFELTYANYLTIPRSVLQSMPLDWQERFVACLRQLDETIDWRPTRGRYWVQLRDEHGRYVWDDLADYERGRRRILPRPFKETP